MVVNNLHWHAIEHIIFQYAGLRQDISVSGTSLSITSSCNEAVINWYIKQTHEFILEEAPMVMSNAQIRILSDWIRMRISDVPDSVLGSFQGRRFFWWWSSASPGHHWDPFRWCSNGLKRSITSWNRKFRMSMTIRTRPRYMAGTTSNWQSRS